MSRPPHPHHVVLLVGQEWVTTRPGGLNRYLHDLLHALRDEGIRTHAVVVGAYPQGLGGVTGVSEPEAPLWRRLVAVLRATHPVARSVDVVDVHFALYGLLPVLTTRLRRRPLVVHFQGPWAAESAVARGEGGMVVRAKVAVERTLYRRAKVVVVLSEAFGRLVVERYGVEPSRVVVLPPGVDLVRFSHADRTGARASMGLEPDAFVAVSVRRLEPRMGLDVLLDAWARVQAELPEAVLVIAGEGREWERLEAQRRTLPSPGSVRLVGGVGDDELVRLYQAADCSVVPTRALEGFGLVTLESLACGTPPIVTDVGGLPDGVVALDPSLIVPREDAEALAARLLAAAAGELPSSAVCRAHAERFSWRGVARRHVEVYERARGSRPLRVAFVGHSAALSGGELALARLLPALDGVEPVVILAEDGPLAERLQADGVKVEVLPLAPRTRALTRDRVSPRRLPIAAVRDTVTYAWRLRTRLHALDVRLVHTNTLKAALYGGVAGRLAAVPVVWHVRDRIAPDYLPRATVSLVRAAARVLPDALVANSETTLATIVSGLASGGRFVATVAPSPVQPPAEVHRTADRPFTIGIVGRLAPWKGQDLFLKAFATAFGTGEERALVVGAAMFGEDEWAASLVEQAAKLGIDDRVEFTGFADDVWAQYERMDVAVHASVVPEPLGQVVLEAMAAGLPVVAPCAGGPAEVITDGVNGLLYPMGDAAALAEHLRRLAADGELRARLGDAGRRRAEGFSPARVAEKILAVYRHLGLSRDESRRGSPTP